MFLFSDELFKKEILFVKVSPNAKKTELVSILEDGTLKIKIHAPPEDGKANKELLIFLKKETNCNWEIIQGKTSTQKKLRRIE